MRLLRRFLADESGATAIEYVMIGGLVSILIISGTMIMGSKMDLNFSKVGSALQ